MSNIEVIVRQINRHLVPQFEEKLRAHLELQDRDWLIEQVIRLTLDAHSLEERDRTQFRGGRGSEARPARQAGK